MWIAVGLVFVLPPAAFAALGYYVLPYWVVLVGFALLPTVAMVLYTYFWGEIESWKEKSSTATKGLKSLQSEKAKTTQTEKELGNAYGQARSQLVAAQAEIVGLNQQLSAAVQNGNHLSKALKEEKSLVENLKQEFVTLKRMKSVVDAELTSTRLIASEVMELRPLKQRVISLEGKAADLTSRVRTAEAYARARENWVPFAISDDDFAMAVAKVFK